jgi:hypothetical protein
MLESISDLLANTHADPWRAAAGFSAEISEANKALFDADVSPEDKAEMINGWIQKHQPCLFGRIAAKGSFLSYCVLVDSDLNASDDHIREKIQTARTRWTREGFEGAKSGFIILAISERLAFAEPDDYVKRLAKRLCELYLLRDIEPDSIAHDEIWLEKPGRDKTTWKWHAGVNYFAAHADQRWWHDHRIPGGIAFSVNSVGHMVKSGILAKAMISLEESLGAPPEDWEFSKVDSLGKALELAMRTISLASDSVSGKATKLLSLPVNPDGQVQQNRPVELPLSLAGKNFREYLGHYHTDFTLPSEYFRADVARPDDVRSHVLDFTYLFDDSIENPDHVTMGSGRQIREDGTVRPAAATTRSKRFVEEVVAIADQARLVAAIGETPI